MKISILTLFPQMFEVFNSSIVSKAKDKGIVDIELINIRDFSNNKHNKVDDYPFGGGAGMLMRVEPIYLSIMHVKQPNSHVIYLGPRGESFEHKKAKQLSYKDHLIFLCGHYEGIDERCYEFIDEEISLGDFILTGGEMAAIPIVDSIIRLLPNVINKKSLESESFSNGVMDFPQYTKPRSFMGMDVPEVLLSGNHKKIDKWREDQSLKITQKFKSHLLKKDN